MGDGKITIGYGHAEPKTVANFKIGDEISENDAAKLFCLDVKEAEDGVRRLFKIWEEQGLDVRVSQHMWDSMVSMAFNMGVNGFRGSEIVQYLKQQNYFQAANKIPDTRIENADEFPGLIQRRELEAYPTNLHTSVCISGDLNFKLCRNPSIELHFTPSISNGCGAKLLNAFAG